MEEIILTIRAKSKDLLSLLGYEAEPIITQRNNVYFVNFQMDEPIFLIGRNGDTLESLQHLLRLMMKKLMSSESELHTIIVDVNGYRSKKNDLLEKKVRDVAYKVRTTEISHEFEPMNSFERRIIHALISNIADVESESVGEREHRRVVVKPKKK